MNQLINKILPKSVDNNYKGYRIAAIVFLLVAIMGTVRSCIHFLGSIAGMDLSVAGANGIVFAFSLWEVHSYCMPSFL